MMKYVGLENVTKTFHVYEIIFGMLFVQHVDRGGEVWCLFLTMFWLYNTQRV